MEDDKEIIESDVESGSEIASDVEESEVEEESEAEQEESEAEQEEGEGEGEEEGEEEGEGDAEEETGVNKTDVEEPNKSSGRNKKNISDLKAIKTKQTKKSIPIFEDEDDEEDDEFYLQKFDKELRENFIMEHHPEAKSHNYEEVKALSRISRDGNGIINDPFHKTIPFLTKYEKTRILGQRAKQIDNGAKPFVKVPPNIIDGYQVALLELEQKKIPFIIKRPYPNGGVEYWHVSDLEMLN